MVQQHSQHHHESQPPAATTVGELRASGHVYRTVKEEIRQNLLAMMRAGQDPFPGIVGFGQTVLPHLERALIAGHDIILLGERGQGKTRLIRTLAGLLDEWTPVVEGCEINDHPYHPACARCRRLAAELGDALPVSWRPASERYGEKLATPDTSVGDLIGDIDPVKVAEGRTLGDPETIHFGLVPRTNRGIFSLNELPDLAERIQVSLLNVLEERDIGIRGYALRLPLDLLLVASANPEDYTNRGRIITPLKDRFGAEIRTHYPPSLTDELTLIRQEAHIWTAAELPDHLVEVIARFTRGVRESSAVDARSGVSARHRRGGNHRRVGRAPVGPGGVVGRDAGRPGVRPAHRGQHAARQGRVRGQRGGPGRGSARRDAAPGDRRHVPVQAGQRGSFRPAGQVRGRRHRRVG
jgi:magnesium chelatase subunit I